MWCDYEQLDNKFVCRVCGDVSRRLTHRPCGQPTERPPELPPLHKRLVNFSRASIEHAQAGFPTCTQEQIDARFAICIGCELYLPDKENPAIGHCCHASCGCPITQLGRYVSKLGWVDQKCPLGKWLSLVPASSLAKVDGPGIIRN